MSEDEITLNDIESVIVVCCSAGISAIGSVLIIYIIMKSNRKLSSTYHRIIFATSLAALVASIAIGLATLPLPRDDNNLTHEGLRLGNASTCIAQGYFIQFGLSSMMLYGASLWVYYCCSIGFQMNEIKTKKFVEPFLHLIPILIALVLATVPLFVPGGGYGASNQRPFCYIVIHPLRDKLYKQTLFPLYIALFLSIILISLVIIIRQVCRAGQEALLVHGTNSPSHLGRAEVRRHVKVILVQAAAYLISYTITTFLPPLLLSRLEEKGNFLLLRLELFLFQMQGFFNFCIFVGHKVYSFLRLNNDDNDYCICEAMGILFHTGGHEEPLIFTSLSLVHKDREDALERMRNCVPNGPGAVNEDGVIISEKELSSCYDMDTKSGLKLYLGSSDKDKDQDDDGLSGFEITSVISSAVRSDNGGDGTTTSSEKKGSWLGLQKVDSSPLVVESSLLVEQEEQGLELLQEGDSHLCVEEEPGRDDADKEIESGHHAVILNDKEAGT